MKPFYGKCVDKEGKALVEYLAKVGSLPPKAEKSQTTGIACHPHSCQDITRSSP